MRKIILVLLSLCLNHRTLASETVKPCVMDPKNPVLYTLASSVYAACGWEVESVIVESIIKDCANKGIRIAEPRTKESKNNPNIIPRTLKDLNVFKWTNPGASGPDALANEYCKNKVAFKDHYIHLIHNITEEYVKKSVNEKIDLAIEGGVKVIFNTKLAGSSIAYMLLEQADGINPNTSRFKSDERDQQVRNTADANIALLDSYNVKHVKNLVQQGVRIPGSGLIAGTVNNSAQIVDYLNNSSNALKIQACLDQAASFLQTPVAEQLKKNGWTLQKYDQSKKSATGTEHMFVLATSSDGKTYRVDPWYNKVEPFDPKADDNLKYKGVQP
jgi:hypothetical protein